MEHYFVTNVENVCVHVCLCVCTCACVCAVGEWYTSDVTQRWSFAIWSWAELGCYQLHVSKQNHGRCEQYVDTSHVAAWLAHLLQQPTRVSTSKWTMRRSEGGACFQEVSHAVAFAQMCSAVCHWQLSFLCYVGTNFLAANVKMFQQLLV